MGNLNGNMGNMRFLLFCAIIAAIIIATMLMREILVLALGPTIGQNLVHWMGERIYQMACGHSSKSRRFAAQCANGTSDTVTQSSPISN